VVAGSVFVGEVKDGERVKKSESVGENGKWKSGESEKALKQFFLQSQNKIFIFLSLTQ
jgi:hypothetical protein